MSKERARRRAEREREAAMRAHARARQQERRERQARRRTVLRGMTSDRVRPGRPSGVLAQRRRRQNRLLTAALLFLVVVVWVVRPDWPARLAVVVVCVLAWPVLRLLLFSRR